MKGRKGGVVNGVLFLRAGRKEGTGGELEKGVDVCGWVWMGVDGYEWVWMGRVANAE